MSHQNPLEAHVHRPARRPRRLPILRALAVASALAVALIAAPAQAQQTTFAKGSLIIPTSSAWQDPCGMVSLYGMIYDILRADDGIAAYPSGTLFTQRITVNWVYLGTKKSPNRCVPTNLDSPPTSTSDPNPSSSDTTWNDGCDIVIDGSASNTTPATQISNTDTTLSTSTDTSIASIDTTYSSAFYPHTLSGASSCSSTKQLSCFGPNLAFPNFSSRTVTATSNATTDVNLIRYGGGAFVISGTDVPAFLALLTGKEVHKDSQGNNIDFSPFRTKGTASSTTTPNGCAVGLTGDNGYNLATFTTTDNSGTFGGNSGVGFSLSYANEHWVNIHRAQLPFTATDTARMTGRPPAIGLLQTVGGQFNPENTSTLASGIKGAQLTYYLKSAGLDFSGAAGCPAGGFNVNNSVTESDPALTSGKTNTQIFCPNGGVSGQVFDYLDAIDIANGLLSNYSVVWIPHFQTLSGGSLPTPCRTGVYTSSNNCETQAMTQVGSFLSSQNHGFMGECITISSLEGASGIPTLTNSTQSLTCPDGGSGLCGSGTTTTGLTINNSSYENLRLDNCSNPAMPANSGSGSNGYTDAVTTTANGITCMNFSSPGSPFAQIGDFRWFAYSGGTDNYASINSGSSQTTYKPGVITLAYTIGSLNTTTLSTNPRSLASVDNFSFIQRDNNSNEAQVVYLAGHNYTGDVAGTRVALNTVLALGLIVTTNESAFVGATLYQGTVFVPTYYEITTVSPLVEWRVFNPALGSKWHFPYHTGNLRIHSLETNSTVDGYANYTSVGGTSFFQGNQAKRNIFTYLDGAVTTSGVPSGIAGQVAQMGWTPISFDTTQIVGSSCVDKYHVGPWSILTDGGLEADGGGGYAAMIPGRYADGTSVCDLQEALAINLTATEIGADYGAQTSEQQTIESVLTNTAQLDEAAQLVQMVRGYCYATTTHVDNTGTVILNPSATDGGANGCNDITQYGTTTTPTLNALGGIVHSQVAVIPDTPYVTNTNGYARPTVAYVGALDGQLHAFYIPRSDSAEIGYTGPSVAPATLNTAANTIFPNNMANKAFASSVGNGSQPYAELWSFIPPGQLPFLYSNEAQVDSSPVVIDAFADFDGDGIRTWHTVLVASAGGTNRELFALDVTNPLAPTLLWDLQSSYDSTIPYAPVPLANNNLGLSTTDEAFTWQNNCRDGGTAACSPAQYQLPPTTDPGRSLTGPYNYMNLGASQSISVAAMRRNGQPVFAAFVATNEPGGNGVHVFAIDISTGQKIWEWDSPYDTLDMSASQASGVGNTAPAGVSLLSKAGNSLIDTVYVGDDTGALWELDAASGLSLTSYSAALNCASGSCNYALSEAFGDGGQGPQPISTLSTLFYVSGSVPTTSAFANYVGQTLLAYGTGGTDTVTSLASPPNGGVHVLSTAASGRYQAAAIAAAPSLAPVVQMFGVAQEVPGYPYYLSGQRVFGSIVATNDTLFFNGTGGTVADIDERGSSTTETGTTYALSLNASASSAVSALSNVNNGGVGGTVTVNTSVAGQVTVVTVTDQKIVTTVDKNTNTVAAQHSVNNVGFTGTGLLGWIVRKSGHDY